MEQRSPGKATGARRLSSSRGVAADGAAKRPCGSLLFDEGDEEYFSPTIYEDTEKATVAPKKRSVIVKRISRKTPAVGVKEPDPVYSNADIENGNKTNTGVPRADSVGFASSEAANALEFSPPLSQAPLMDASGASSVIERRELAQSDSFVAIASGIRALQDSLILQQKLTQRILEWQERFEAASLQECFRSQQELGQSILERQKRLEDSIQSCMQGGGNMLAASRVIPSSNTAAFSAREDYAAEGEPRSELLQISENKPLRGSDGDRCKFSFEDEEVLIDDMPEDDEKPHRVASAQSVCADSVFVAKRVHDEDERRQSVQLHQHWKSRTHDLHHNAGNCIERIANHPYFEYMSACVILSHSLFIGIYVEYTASVDAKGHVGFTVGNIILTFVFLCEVFIKFAAEKKEFVLGNERVWNVFDLSLIFLVLLELSLGIVLAGKDKKKMKTVLKIAEMARTIRILRIFRFLKFSETLQVIIVKIFMSIRTLLWVFLLISMMQGVVAVCFTQGAIEYLGGIQHDTDIQMDDAQMAVYKHFGSVPKSVKTCFASISGGLLWEDVSEELGYISVLYALVFGLYIVASTFAMLNIITGIFINDMLRAEKDLEEEYRMIKLERYHMELSQLFLKMDEENGKISMDEFLDVSENKIIGEILDDLNMTQEEASTLFQLLDEDCSGELDVDEFLAGCMHLMAGTTGLDMKVMLYEQRRMRHRFTNWMQDTDIMLNNIRTHVKGVEKDLHKQPSMLPARKNEPNSKSLKPGTKKKEPQTLAGKIIRDAEKKRKESSGSALRSADMGKFVNAQGVKKSLVLGAKPAQ